MARTALMSPAHFSREFEAAYREAPYSSLMTRRIERAKALLRQGVSVTEIVGEPPSQYRGRDHSDLEIVPACVSMFATRPQRSVLTV